jgi:hypothetical protein
LESSVSVVSLFLSQSLIVTFGNDLQPGNAGKSVTGHDADSNSENTGDDGWQSGPGSVLGQSPDRHYEEAKRSEEIGHRAQFAQVFEIAHIETHLEECGNPQRQDLQTLRNSSQSAGQAQENEEHCPEQIQLSAFWQA